VRKPGGEVEAPSFPLVCTPRSRRDDNPIAA
jgi:hypothetical protein